MAEVTGEFDFLVAGGRDFGDGARKVGLHGVANGVELKTDALDLVRWVFKIGFEKPGVKWEGGPGGLGRGGKRCGKRTADKSASVHAPHSTSSGRQGTGIPQKKRKTRGRRMNPGSIRRLGTRNVRNRDANRTAFCARGVWLSRTGNCW